MELFWKLVFLMYSFTLVSSEIEDIGCDPGWLIAFDTCYLVNNKKQVTWKEAITECNRFDASPIYFETPELVTWYRNLTSTQYPSSGYWTNMNRIVDNDPNGPGAAYWSWGMYEYVDTSVIQWSSSPANDGRPACGGVNLQGNMYDADCNSRQGYICQIDNAITTQGGCPMGWMNTDTSPDCYYVSNTSDAGQLMSWSQAKTWCTNLSPGAHLFVIDDVNDQNFLLGDLSYVARSTHLFWTGLQGTGRLGGWSWINGAFLNQALFSWAVEPDNVANRENCGVIRYNGQFSDRDCSSKQNYICRKNEEELDTNWNLGCGLWTRAGSMCYNFYTEPKSTWMDAKQTCTSFGGDLMNVYSIDLKVWLIEQMLDPAIDNFYWTALNDRDTEGTYKWGDGSVLAPNVINWNQEPNSWGGDEDCGMLMVGSETYTDMFCGFQYAPLCELDSVQTCPGSAGGTWVSRPSDSGVGVDCYMFGQYANTSQLMTWDEASDYCKTLAVRSLDQFGTPTDKVPKLYAVNSASERDFMAQQLETFMHKARSIFHYGFWTELTDRYDEGYWQFGNDPSIDTSFVTWDKEPYNGDADSNCVAVASDANFIVVNCSWEWPFICERAAYLPWGTSEGTRISILPWITFLTLPMAAVY